MADALTKAGRYGVVSELGRGSMGVVYEGFDPVIGRRVAIKTMLTEGLTSQEFLEFKARFQREAQAAGILTHPNIVNVFDYGEDNGVLYLIMEYLEGKSLEKMVEDQNILPIETIIPMYDQVCGALDHAHQHNIVHRDIKPANIMILDSGLVKVTDFGIAKMMSLGMTQAGQILGTPNYMSPEQVKGRQIDGRSDIFSLGVILYELVTGEKPFGGQNITTVIYKIINENPIPPRELDATIHPGLSYVICRALAKSPEERYQTCRELADGLRNFKLQVGQAAPCATVVLNAPPLQSAGFERASVSPAESWTVPPAPTQPVGKAPVGHPLPPQAPVAAIPPVRTHPERHTSPIVWIFLTLCAVVILGILGGGGYYLFKGKSQAPNPQVGQTPPTVNLPGENPLANPPTVPPTQATEKQSKGQGEKPAAGRQEPSKRELGGVVPLPSFSSVRQGAAGKAGQLLVTANISGSKISVDGHSEPGWVTPFTIANLPAGSHQVVVSKEGYDDYQQAVTIESGKTNSLNAYLSVPSGEVNIITTPAGLDVLIDGKLIGPSPARASVVAGNHRYEIRRPGAAPYENQFTIESGALKKLKINLGGEAAETGIIEVRTIPSGATVLADGNSVGGRTPTSFRLSAGQHTLVISLSGFRPVQQVVEVKASGTIPVNISLPSQ